MANLRKISQVPPLYALRDTTVLPIALFGPVDFSQGRHFLINLA
ncbi:MAG: hypothetical protein AB2604_17285 [Candidatus Thiodiazotropha taylori]